MTRDEILRLDEKGIAAWDNHDPDAWIGLFADKFVWHDWTMPEPIRDMQAARQYFSGWVTAFPDMKVKQVNRVVGDDSVAVDLEWSGTNTGPMVMGGMTIPPTNKKVVGRGAYFARASNGKITEFRSRPDVAGMMTQLGMMPAR